MSKTRTWFTGRAGVALTSIAAAIYESSLGQYVERSFHNFYRGFSQILRMPAFLQHAANTRQLIQRAARANFLQFLLPMILVRRGVNFMAETHPDSAAYFDLLMTLVLGMRLCLRLFAKNATYMAELPDAVAKDIDVYLPNVLATEFSRELSEIFYAIFTESERNTPGVAASIKRSLQSELFNLLHMDFTLFFKNKPIAAEGFRALVAKLTGSFYSAIKKQDFSIDDTFLEQFSEWVASVIVRELSSSYHAEKPIIEIPETLTHAIKQKFLTRDIQTAIINPIVKIKEHVFPLLPIDHIQSCACTKKMTVTGTGQHTIKYHQRIVSAALSSPGYYMTNRLLFLFLFALIKKIFQLLSLMGDISPQNGRLLCFLADINFVMIDMLIAGQAQNEYQLAKTSQCTYHRYRLFSQIKANSLGRGAAQALPIFLVGSLLHWATGIDGTEDTSINSALSYFFLLANTIPSLAFNEPLARGRRRGWDMFVVPRKISRWSAEQLCGLYLPDSRDDAEKSELISDVKNFLSSPLLYAGVNHVLGGGEFVPPIPFEIDASTGKVKVVRGDITLIFFNNPDTRNILQLHSKKIYEIIDAVENLRRISNWIASPLMALPLPATIAFFLLLPLQVLQLESLTLLLNKLKLRLIDLQIAKKTEMTEVPALPSAAAEEKSSLLEEEILRAINTKMLLPGSDQVIRQLTSSLGSDSTATEEKKREPVSDGGVGLTSSAGKTFKIGNENDDDDWSSVQASAPTVGDRANILLWQARSAWQQLPGLAALTTRRHTVSSSSSSRETELQSLGMRRGCE